LWRRMRDDGVTAAALEVSSHGLALRRIDATRISVAAFTNLSQDHLDFHRDLEDYFAAKARLFTPELSERAVVVVDDAWGRRMAAEAGVPVTTVALSGPADWTAVDVQSGPEGSTFTARHDGGSV